MRYLTYFFHSVKWIKYLRLLILSSSRSISNFSLWSFIHMIKSVYHQTVHSTFQYMMRPSLKLGLLQWSHFGEQRFFLSVVSPIIVGTETLSILLMILFNKWFDLKCKHTQTVLYFVCGVFIKILSILNEKNANTFNHILPYNHILDDLCHPKYII